MNLLSVILALSLLGGISQQSKCPCRQAQDQDHPHGANELVQLTDKTVNRVQGRVLDTAGSPIDEAVVEIYECTYAERRLSAYEVANSKERRTACLTDKEGNFCFTGLPSGSYVVRIGTRQAAGMQEIFMKISLDRRWWSGWLRSGKKLEIYLPLGW